MKKNLFLALALIALISSIGLFSTLKISAQDNQGNGQALEISPPVRTLQADPGETITTEILLRNISNGDLIVTGQVNDFVAAGEGGAPKILLDEDEVEDNPFSIKGWVQPLPEILIVSKELKSFPITIEVPEDASPGGHYGVFRFSAVAPSLQDSGVSLSTSLGTLMLIEVSGDINESLEIAEFSISEDGEKGDFFESAPLVFTQRLKNTGNTHVEPRGQIAIKDMFGRTTAALNVNLPPRNVLPDSVRRFEQNLDSSVIGDKILFGKYTAELSLTYGNSEQELNDKLSFWVIPYRLIGAIILGLIVGFFLLRFLLRKYNQYVINKSKRN